MVDGRRGCVPHGCVEKFYPFSDHLVEVLQVDRGNGTELFLFDEKIQPYIYFSAI